MTVFNTIQGTSSTSFRVGLTGPTIYTGSADPTVTPPTPLADGFRDGDIYFRTATGGSAIWVIDNGGTWTQIASGAAGGTFSGDIVMNPGAQFLGDDAAGAGAPAFAFDGDPDTGMFNPNPNEIGFSVGGTQAFVIESDGTLASTTAGYELLVLADNDIPNRKYVEDTFINAAGDTFTGDLSMGAGTQIFLATGTATDPALAFAGDTNTGLYSDGPNVMGVAVGGTELINFNISGIQAVNGGQFVGDTSTAAIPAFVFNGDSNTGLFHDTPGEFAFSTDGTERLRLDTTTLSGTSLWRGGDGVVGSPGISFSGDPDTGFYRTGSGSIGLATNGTNPITFDATAATGTMLWRGGDGTAVAPGVSFSSDDDTGMFLSASDTIGFTAGGTPSTFIAPEGIRTIDGSTTDPAWSFSGDPDTGVYRFGSGSMGFTANGVTQLVLTTTDARFDQQVRVEESNQGAGGPGFSFTGDDDTGVYNGGPNSVGFSTGGIGRWEVNSAGDFLPQAGTYDIGTSGTRVSTVFATTFDGTATAAQYSDLAERYTVGDCCDLEPGDVVVICDHEDHDICLCEDTGNISVLGVVSTAPAFMMNKDAGDDKTAPYIALRGRVPVKVCGDVKKGDLLITCGVCDCHDPCAGHARALTDWEIQENDYSPHAVFAKALRSHDGQHGDGTVEAVIL